MTTEFGEVKTEFVLDEAMPATGRDPLDAELERERLVEELRPIVRAMLAEEFERFIRAEAQR